LHLPQGFSQGEDFFTYLRDSFDALYAEGADSPKNDEHRNALPLAGQTWAYRGVAKVFRPYREARQSMGVPPYRYRPPLEARCILSRRIEFLNQDHLKMTSPLITLQHNQQLAALRGCCLAARLVRTL
jgi:hypothetical protein